MRSALLALRSPVPGAVALSLFDAPQSRASMSAHFLLSSFFFSASGVDAEEDAPVPKAATRFCRRRPARGLLNQVVPRHTARGSLSAKVRVSSTAEMARAAWGREPMKGRGQE